MVSGTLTAVFITTGCLLLPHCSVLTQTGELSGGAPDASGSGSGGDSTVLSAEASSVDASVVTDAAAIKDADASVADVGVQPCSGCDSGTTCPTGMANCDNSPSNGCEVNLLDDRAHCGACGTACTNSTGALCTNASCTFPTSCAALLGMTPAFTSGVYRIQPDGAGAFDTYCDLDTSAAGDGGGWTLLLKVNGASSVFTYDAPLWTNTAAYNPDKPGLDVNEAKLAGFSTLPFSAVRIGLLDAGVRRWLVLPISSDSMLSLFTGPHIQTSAGRDAWRALVASPSTEANCNREGFNTANDNSAVRIRLGIMFNNENDCSSPGGFIGMGADFGTSSDNVAGNYEDFGAAADNGTRDTKAIAYLMAR